MNYRKKEYEEIFLQGLQNALEQKLISQEDKFIDYIKNKEDIENFYVMLLSVHAEWIAEIYEAMQLIYDSTFVDKAEGIDLDHIGEWVGVPRPVATRSYVDLVFHLNNPLEQNLVIPEGVFVASRKSDGVNYRTAKRVELAAGEYEVVAPAYSTRLGADSSVAADELNKIDSAVSEFKGTGLRVRNDYASTGGGDVMGDEEYRQYLKNWTRIQQKGNAWAYRNYFANLDGLDSYNLIPMWDGAGTLKIVIDKSGESPYLADKIYKEVMEEVALFDDDIYITDAIKREISISCRANVDLDTVVPFTVDEKKALLEKLKLLVKVFVDGGDYNGKHYKGMVIGEDFIPHKLGVFLDKNIPELKNITFDYPAEPIVLNDEEIGVLGELNIEME